MDQITIFLAPIEVERFKLFQKHHALFEELEDKGVFNIKFGKCTLNYAFGELQNIVKEEVVYKK